MINILASFFRKYPDLNVLAFNYFMAVFWWWPLPKFLVNGQLEWPPGDPLYNQWIIAWGARALSHFPWRFFDGNMFYPFDNVIAWGDHLFSLTIFAAPFIPVLGLTGAYNLLLISSSALSAFTAYLFLNYLIKHRLAAVIGGLIWGFSYYRFTEYGHIQALWTVWIPLVFLYSEILRTKSSRQSFWLFVVFCWLLLATNIYFAFFTIISFALYLLGLVMLGLIRLKNIISILSGWIIAGFLAVPLYYYSIAGQIKNPLERNIQNQASLFLHGLYPWPWPGHIFRFIAERFNDPVNAPATFHSIGLLTWALLIVGIIKLTVVLRKNRQYRVIVIFFMLAIFAVFAATGPRLIYYDKILLEPNPVFGALYHYIPGYKVLRVPMRWFFFVLLGLLPLAILGLKYVLQFFKKPKQYVVVLAFALWIFIEQSPAPIKVYPTYQISDYPVVLWLSEQPGEFAILELPVFPGVGNLANDLVEGRRMYFSTFHWKKRVSGAISPNIPEQYVRNAQILNAIGDNSQAIRLLQEWQVKYIIFIPHDFDNFGWSQELKTAVKNRLDSMRELNRQIEFSDGTVVYQIIY